MTGASGEDLIIKTPVGTQIFDENGELMLADLNQEEQAAHFDNQPKSVKLAMRDVCTGLHVALEAMRKLREIKVLEDEEDNNPYKE